MQRELNVFVYGGSPRKLHSKPPDASTAETETMLSWCKQLKEFGDYADFISRGGVSWLDAPLPGGRRLFLRVFATTGESRNAWWFLGLLLSNEDYTAIGDYGKLVESIESFTVEDLRNRRPDSSKLSIELPAQTDQPSSMPPLFPGFNGELWEQAPWVQQRAHHIEQRNTQPFLLTFNPPTAKVNFTALILSEDFPRPGLRLQSQKPKAATPDTPAVRNAPQVVKKKTANQLLGGMLMGSLLAIPAFYVGHQLSSPVATHRESGSIEFVYDGERHGIARGPRTVSATLPYEDAMPFNVVLEASQPQHVSLSSSTAAIVVGKKTVARDSTIRFDCRLHLPDNSNAALQCLLHISRQANGEEHAVETISVTIEPAGISLEPELRILRGANADSATPTLLSGVVAAKYGIASVKVGSREAEVRFAKDPRAAFWFCETTGLADPAKILVTDRRGNKAIFNRPLPAAVAQGESP